MEITDLLRQVKVRDGTMLEISKENPKQFISKDIKIPVWRIKYSYKTLRGNSKTGNKYLFLGEQDWDLVEIEFMDYINKYNQQNHYKSLSNVQILDIEYIGEFVLELQ